jgi:hypothetical protein
LGDPRTVTLEFRIAGEQLKQGICLLQRGVQFLVREKLVELCTAFRARPLGRPFALAPLKGLGDLCTVTLEFRIAGELLKQGIGLLQRRVQFLVREKLVELCTAFRARPLGRQFALAPLKGLGDLCTVTLEFRIARELLKQGIGLLQRGVQFLVREKLLELCTAFRARPLGRPFALAPLKGLGDLFPVALEFCIAGELLKQSIGLSQRRVQLALSEKLVNLSAAFRESPLGRQFALTLLAGLDDLFPVALEFCIAGELLKQSIGLLQRRVQFPVREKLPDLLAALGTGLLCARVEDRFAVVLQFRITVELAEQGIGLLQGAVEFLPYQQLPYSLAALSTCLLRAGADDLLTVALQFRIAGELAEQSIGLLQGAVEFLPCQQLPYSLAAFRARLLHEGAEDGFAVALQVRIAGELAEQIRQHLQGFIEPLYGQQLPRLFAAFPAHLAGVLFGQFALLPLAGGESGFPIPLDLALAGIARQKPAQKVQRCFEIAAAHKAVSFETARGAGVAALLGGLFGMHGLEHRFRRLVARFGLQCSLQHLHGARPPSPAQQRLGRPHGAPIRFFGLDAAFEIPQRGRLGRIPQGWRQFPRFIHLALVQAVFDPGDKRIQLRLAAEGQGALPQLRQCRLAGKLRDCSLRELHGTFEAAGTELVLDLPPAGDDPLPPLGFAQPLLQPGLHRAKVGRLGVSLKGRLDDFQRAAELRGPFQRSRRHELFLDEAALLHFVAGPAGGLDHGGDFRLVRVFRGCLFQQGDGERGLAAGDEVTRFLQGLAKGFRALVSLPILFDGAAQVQHSRFWP